MENRIRQLRKENGLTLQQLAAKINMSINGLAMIERCERGLTQENVIMFAELFNVSADYILGLSDIKKPAAPNNPKQNLPDLTKANPLALKLMIILQGCNDDELERVIDYALFITSKK